MGDDASESQSIVDVGRTCLRLFFAVATLIDPHQLPSTDTVTLKLITAEGDRFKLWSANLGLLVPGHGSLDYRVREAEGLANTLRSFLFDLLDSLQEVLDYGRSIVDSAAPTNDAASTTDVGNELVEDSAELEEDVLDILLDSIKDVIDRLFRLSVKIRNPITRLESSKARHFQLLYDDVNLFAAVEHFDLDYVRTVFLQYAVSRLQQGFEPTHGFQAPDAGWHSVSDCQLCEANPEVDKGHEYPRLANLPEHYLVRRIARANVRRRQQFAYWKHRKLKLIQHTERESNHLQATGVAQIDLSSPLADNNAPVALQTQSVTTASQLHPSLHAIDETMSAVSVSEYTPSNRMPSDETITFPQPPRCPDTDQFFECPYCHITCAKKTSKERAWNAHLIHDLRPYICTFPDCTNPDQLYDRKADWVHHENSQHRQHPVSNNAAITQAAQSELAIAQMDARTLCPICSASILDVATLQNHMALHLERLAAFSFPRSFSDDEDVADETGSDDANFGQGSRSDDFDERSALGSFADNVDSPLSSRSSEGRDTALAEGSTSLNDKSLADATITTPGLPIVVPQLQTQATTEDASNDIGTEGRTKHWAKQVFLYSQLTNTSIPPGENADRNSECFPFPDDDQDLPKRPEFNEVLAISFSPALTFRFLVRDLDSNAYAMCEYRKGESSASQTTKVAAVAVSELYHLRQGCLLFLHRIGTGNSLWAQLKFASIEFMILFHCTFLALRAQAAPQLRFFDTELRHETLEFAAVVRSNDRKHVIRLHRDGMTGVMRLEASPFDVLMRSVPVWTAFITERMASPTWTRGDPQGSNIILLAELNCHIFTSAYQPLEIVGGEHVLRFDLPNDADNFERIIKKLRVKYTKASDSLEGARTGVDEDELTKSHDGSQVERTAIKGLKPRSEGKGYSDAGLSSFSEYEPPFTSPTKGLDRSDIVDKGFEIDRRPNTDAVGYHRVKSGDDSSSLSNDILQPIDTRHRVVPLPEEVRFDRSSVTLSQLARALQGEQGIKLEDRQGQLLIQRNCFTGADLTTWLQLNFRDIHTRNQAVIFGNELMKKGLFTSEGHGDDFKDGNYMYSLAAEHSLHGPDEKSSALRRAKEEEAVDLSPTRRQRSQSLETESMAAYFYPIEPILERLKNITRESVPDGWERAGKLRSLVIEIGNFIRLLVRAERRHPKALETQLWEYVATTCWLDEGMSGRELRASYRRIVLSDSRPDRDEYLGDSSSVRVTRDSRLASPPSVPHELQTRSETVQGQSSDKSTA